MSPNGRLGLIVSVMVLFAVGSVISNVNAETMQMYVQTMPRQWQDQYGDILSQATQYWEKSIPGIKFETSNQIDKSDFVVEWTSQNGQGKLGYYSTDTSNDYGKPVMAITLGFFEEGKWRLVPAESVLLVTEHELGHLLQIQHSTNPEDIMYPTVDDYESVQSVSEQTMAKSTTVDWHALSEKQQKMASEKILPLESQVNDAYSVLSSTSYGTKAANDILDDAWMSYWWAKKYLADSEKAQTDAGAFVLQSDFENSYAKFKESYDSAKKVEQKIQQITESIEKASSLS
ncbi:MAG: matrixin family metalloprotease [Thaumarchaeota archaeon]|nr:matrixin family metalloprotease [Nitrososphaerota archaeon]